MSTLRNEEKRLILDVDANAVNNVFLKSFLINKLGFFYSEPKKQYIFEKEVSSDLIESVIEFFKELNLPLEIDSFSKSLYQQNISERVNFEILRQKGFSIKNEPRVTIQVPSMKKEKTLQWYQMMPILHGVEMGNVANFSVPGSGKTWMAYSTYFLLKERKEVDRLLVIGPISSFRPWENEFKEITGKKPNSIRISGTPAKRKEIFNHSHLYEIFLVSYDTARIEQEAITNLLQQNKFLMIVDESHHIKNPYGENTSSVLYLSRFAKNRLVLSGTPIPNKLDDLWSQFTFLYPRGDLLGSYETFQFELSRGNPLEYLRQSLFPFYTRVSKNMLDLPKPEYVRLRIPMGKIQRRIYDAIRGFIRENDRNLRDDYHAVQRWRNNCIVYLIEASSDPSLLKKNSQYHEQNIESEGLPMQQLIDEYQRFEIPEKLKVVKELAEKTLIKDQKIIIWCSFIPTIKKISDMLKKYKPISIWGEVPKDDQEDESYNREKEIERFKTNSNHNLLIANPASLAESISLHKVCHHAIYFDRTFNGGHYMQSLERIHRIGMEPKIKTRYTILLSKKSVDELIDERLEQKKERMIKFLNEEDFDHLNLDYDYDNLFGETSEADEDYRRVFEHIMKD